MDDVAQPALTAEVPQTTRAPGVACPLEPEPEQFYGYRPVNPLEFWLGSQAALPLSVSGAGYFGSRDRAAPNQLRFTREVQLAVAPDGVLVDEREAPLLGYGTSASAGGPCVAPLRAPQFAPALGSSRVSISMNLDPRDPALVFDVAEPSANANFSVSFQVFDSRGGTRTVDVYFARDFVEDNYLYNSVSYHVLVDGSDLVDGTPGSDVEVGAGSLQFTSEGALNIATTPEVCFSFAAATAQQCITLDFGADITNNGATGLSQVTAFATESAVYALSVDGNTVGTGEFVSVDPHGEVSVYFDNGTALPIGKLALARFAREAALEADAGGRLLATQRSGPAQFGKPLSPGRGSVQIVNSDDLAFNPAQPMSPVQPVPELSPSQPELPPATP